MPGIPLSRAAFSRAHVPSVTLKNWFFESNPTSLEDSVSLVPRPRLKAFAVAGSGPINGLYRKGGTMANAGNSGAIICLSGTELYKVTQTGVPGVGTATLIGYVYGASTRMSAEGNADVVVLTTGAGLYSTNGTALTSLSMPDSKQAYAVDTLNGYFLIASELGRFYWSAIGGTTIDALDYATAESQPDVLRTLKVIGDELWLFGRLSVEVWQPTGDLDLPFQRIGGRTFGIGITASDTCQKMNVGGVDTVCWVGTDRRVYRTNPNPTRISDNGIEEKLRKLEVSFTDNSLNPYATTHSWEGHDFYVLHIPGDGSYAYDLATGLWDEVTSFGRSLFRSAVSTVGPNAQPLIGDVSNGTLWEMSGDVRTDGDDPVVFECTGLLENNGAPTRIKNVILHIGVGSAETTDDDPMVSLSRSDDFGETFDDEEFQPLGRQGERKTRVIWSRLGMIASSLILRWKTTEPVTVRRARYNESYR